MKVVAKKDNGVDNAETITSCCVKMTEALKKDFIGFGERNPCFANQNSDVNIFTCDLFPEGLFYSNMTISFCPFCAESIEVKLT